MATTTADPAPPVATGGPTVLYQLVASKLQGCTPIEYIEARRHPADGSTPVPWTVIAVDLSRETGVDVSWGAIHRWYRAHVQNQQR